MTSESNKRYDGWDTDDEDEEDASLDNEIFRQSSNFRQPTENRLHESSSSSLRVMGLDGKHMFSEHPGDYSSPFDQHRRRNNHRDITGASKINFGQDPSFQKHNQATYPDLKSVNNRGIISFNDENFHEQCPNPSDEITPREYTSLREQKLQNRFNWSLSSFEEDTASETLEDETRVRYEDKHVIKHSPRTLQEIRHDHNPRTPKDSVIDRNRGTHQQPGGRYISIPEFYSESDSSNNGHFGFRRSPCQNDIPKSQNLPFETSYRKHRTGHGEYHLEKFNCPRNSYNRQQNLHTDVQEMTISSHYPRHTEHEDITGSSLDSGIDSPGNSSHNFNSRMVPRWESFTRIPHRYNPSIQNDSEINYASVITNLKDIGIGNLQSGSGNGLSGSGNVMSGNGNVQKTKRSKKGFWIKTKSKSSERKDSDLFQSEIPDPFVYRNSGVLDLLQYDAISSEVSYCSDRSAGDGRGRQRKDCEEKQRRRNHVIFLLLVLFLVTAAVISAVLASTLGVSEQQDNHTAQMSENFTAVRAILTLKILNREFMDDLLKFGSDAFVNLATPYSLELDELFLKSNLASVYSNNHILSFRNGSIYATSSITFADSGLISSPKDVENVIETADVARNWKTPDALQLGQFVVCRSCVDTKLDRITVKEKPIIMLHNMEPRPEPSTETSTKNDNSGTTTLQVSEPSVFPTTVELTIATAPSDLQPSTTLKETSITANTASYLKQATISVTLKTTLKTTAIQENTATILPALPTALQSSYSETSPLTTAKTPAVSQHTEPSSSFVILSQPNSPATLKHDESSTASFSRTSTTPSPSQLISTTPMLYSKSSLKATTSSDLQINKSSRTSYSTNSLSITSSFNKENSYSTISPTNTRISLTFQHEASTSQYSASSPNIAATETSSLQERTKTTSDMASLTTATENSEFLNTKSTPPHKRETITLAPSSATLTGSIVEPTTYHDINSKLTTTPSVKSSTVAVAATLTVSPEEVSATTALPASTSEVPPVDVTPASSEATKSTPPYAPTVITVSNAVATATDSHATVTCLITSPNDWSAVNILHTPKSAVDGTQAIVRLDTRDLYVVATISPKYNNRVRVFYDVSASHIDIKMNISNLGCYDDGYIECSLAGRGGSMTSNRGRLEVTVRPSAPRLTMPAEVVATKKMTEPIVCEAEAGYPTWVLTLTKLLPGSTTPQVVPADQEDVVEGCQVTKVLKLRSYTPTFASNGTVYQCELRRNNEKEMEDHVLTDSAVLLVVGGSVCKGRADNSRLLHPYNCSSHIVCLREEPHIYSCPFSQCFDTVSGQCGVKSVIAQSTNGFLNKGLAGVQCSVIHLNNWSTLFLRRHTSSTATRNVLTATPDGRVTWNDGSLAARSVVSFRSTALQSVLQMWIYVLKCTDEGNYSCSVTGPTHVDDGQTELKVYALPETPTLTVPRTVAEGSTETVKITCEANLGRPPASLTILRKLPNASNFVPVDLTDSSGSKSDSCVTRATRTFTTLASKELNETLFKCDVSSSSDAHARIRLASSEMDFYVIPMSTCKGMSDTFLPHPRDCRHYVQCDSSETLALSCDPQYCFNVDKGKCMPVPKSSSTICQPGQNNTFWPHPSLCNKFVKCDGTREVIQHCPGRQLYSKDGACTANIHDSHCYFDTFA